MRSTFLRRSLHVLPALLVLFCLSHCFDYSERIVFKRDLSGQIQIAYSVPINAQSGESALAFLPVERERIVGRYSSLFFLGQVDLQEYRLAYSLGDSLQFPLRAHVRYRVHFRVPSELERLLLGRSSVLQRRKDVTIRRSFPVARPLPEHSAPFPRRILAMVSEQLENRAMEFRVDAPAGYELSSNYGTARGPALLFRLPLERTLSGKEDIAWRVSLARR